MFDIDGTLTQTDDVDEVCFLQALADVFGFIEVDTDWAGYPHCTDSAILEVLFQTHRGRLPTLEDVTTFQSHFIDLLDRAARTQPFRPIHGACELLGSLASSDTPVSLASGAWECSARLKLKSAGLHVANLPAAFGDDGHERETIMQASLRRAAAAQLREAFDSITYVGDGVWDARASRNLGYRFIGIARDSARDRLLRAEGAQHVFTDYRDLATFLAVLRESPTPQG